MEAIRPFSARFKQPSTVTTIKLSRIRQFEEAIDHRKITDPHFLGFIRP